jgi:hypothetical protein
LTTTVAEDSIPALWPSDLTARGEIPMRRTLRLTVKRPRFATVVIGLVLLLLTASLVSFEALAKSKKHKRHRMVATQKRNDEQKPDDDGETLGVIAADLAVKVDKDKPFDIDVWLEPKDKTFQGTAQVYMEQTVAVSYEPRVFTLQAGETKTVKATVQKTFCGVVQILGRASGWEDLDTVIDTGFNARLRSNITEAIDSGVTKSFSISIVDPQGNPVPLDADLTLTLQGSSVKLKTAQDNAWHDHIEVPLKEGVSSTPALNIQSDSLTADRGLISAQLQSADDLVINNSDIWVDVKARWFVPLLMAMFGGALQSFYKVITQPGNSVGDYINFKSILAMIVGIVSGALAYLLASWNVLGIKVDTTTLQGFVILGFLFAYVGVDVILKNLMPRKPANERVEV